MSVRLREMEAQAAALRLELERRKQGQQVSAAPDASGAGVARAEEVVEVVEEETARKKPRGKTYTQLQAERGVNGLEQAIGYVNRGARGISEVELLSNATESETEEDAEERAASFRRNLIAWGIGSVVVIGLSVVRLPAPRPPRPTWFYLIAALRLQRQLDGLREYAKEGNLEAVKESLDSIKKQGVVEDIRSAAASLTSSSASVSARRMAAEIIEYLDMADYSNYFDKFSLTPETGGSINGFVLDSLDAAKRKIADFLAAMPADQLEKARMQLLT